VLLELDKGLDVSEGDLLYSLLLRVLTDELHGDVIEGVQNKRDGSTNSV
jgi:hypothetical protein